MLQGTMSEQGSRDPFAHTLSGLKDVTPRLLLADSTSVSQLFIRQGRYPQNGWGSGSTPPSSLVWAMRHPQTEWHPGTGTRSSDLPDGI